jgi:hypothetical protein
MGMKCSLILYNHVYLGPANEADVVGETAELLQYILNKIECHEIRKYIT